MDQGGPAGLFGCVAFFNCLFVLHGDSRREGQEGIGSWVAGRKETRIATRYRSVAMSHEGDVTAFDTKGESVCRREQDA